MPRHLTRRQTALGLLSIAWAAHGVTILHQPGYAIADEAIIYEMWPLGARVAVCYWAAIVALVLWISRWPEPRMVTQR